MEDRAIHSTKTPPSTNAGGLVNRLFEPCDAASLVFFRVGFSIVMLWHVWWFCSSGMVEFYFARPEYHLTFFGFEWVKPPAENGMRLVFYAMGASAAGIGLGLCYRLSCIAFFITYTYSFLAEAGLYQNHYYLVSLIAFLLIWMPAHRAFSVDALIWPDWSKSHVPAWCYCLLRFQIAIPYVYGGIAKLNSDWLHGQPVGQWIEMRSDLPVIGAYLSEDWVASFVSYSGIALDFLIVPLLLWKPTRLPAYVVAVSFHFLNSILFQIDFFPWFMMLATLIFFPHNWPRRLLRLPDAESSDESQKSGASLSLLRKMAVGFFAVYMVWQLVFPFRHFAYPGNPSWTEEGQLFAWRMMLRKKDVWIRFYAVDRNTKLAAEIPIDVLLTSRQIMELAVSPDQIVAIAPFLAEKMREIGLQDVEVRAVALASLNGREPQLLIDPDLDLTTVDRMLGHQPWIVPLTEPLREEPWRMPPSQWPQHLEIRLPGSENGGSETKPSGPSG